MPLCTQSDIARSLHVTRITVSKALRDHPDISVQMKKKVRAAAERLGYSPNLIARNMASRKTLTLGLVVPDLENSFFAYATDSIIDAAAERNYNVFVTVSREDHDHEALNIQKLVGMRVDGLLVCVSQETRGRDAFKRLKDLAIPVVYFDRIPDGAGVTSVSFDDAAGTHAAIKALRAAGYTRIAHIAGFANTSIGRDRRRGYVEALRSNRLTVDPRWTIEGGLEVEDGYNAFMKLARAKTLPEVILAVTDRVAMGIYRAAKELHIRIPEDIGVVAFGFNETARSLNPALSVVNQDPRTLGSTAADLLLRMIDSRSRTRQQRIILEEEFVWNDSVRRKNPHTVTSHQ